MPLADRIVIVQNSRAWGRVTRHATPLELAEISRLTALWEMTLPDRRVPGNAPTRPPGLNFAEAAMLEASPRRHQVR